MQESTERDSMANGIEIILGARVSKPRSWHQTRTESWEIMPQVHRARKESGLDRVEHGEGRSLLPGNSVPSCAGSSPGPSAGKHPITRRGRSAEPGASGWAASLETAATAASGVDRMIPPPHLIP